MCLDFNHSEPLHFQLKQKLKDNIFNGKYDKKIPSERILMDQYSVSRTTVRLAISTLVNEGILVKSHGKGTFIASTPVQDWLGSFQSFTETIKNTGMTPASKLLFNGIVDTPKKVKAVLNSKELYLIERLRFADDHPIAIEKHYFSTAIGNQLQEYDLDNIIIYDVLENELGISLWKAKQSITSGMPIEQDAKNLDISPSSSVLVSERVIYDPNGQPIEFLNSIFRPDMYSFNIEMMRTREN